MFGPHHHYVPALKWKRGEQHAVRGLPAAIKSRVTPLVEFVSVPTELGTKRPKKTVVEHVNDGLDALVTCWGTTEPFFLDPADATGGAATAFAGARARALQFVPVTGISRPMVERNTAVTNAFNGICIRVSPDDLMRATLAQDITNFATSHKLAAANVDIILDLGSVSGKNLFFVVSAATAALQALPIATQWRTVTILSSAFPAHMGGVATHGTQFVDRLDFAAWTSLHARRATLPRLPTFGDYGIQHPVGVEGYDPRFMPMSSAVRYTLSAQWLLVKGQSTKKQPHSAQFPILARRLKASGHYCGQTHCVGCDGVHKCSINQTGFGSPEAWRRIGTHHHIAFVAAQLSGVAHP